MIESTLLPVTFIILGLLGGIISEKVIFKKLKKFANKKNILGNKLLFKSLHRIPFLWFVIAGFYGAIHSYPFQQNIAHILERICIIIFLYSVTLVLARLIAGFVGIYGQTKGVSTTLLSNLAKIIVLIVGTLILLQTLGIQITPVLTTLGIGGLTVGLALQDTLANVFSGFYLIISHQVRTGDYVKIDCGHEGYVTDINWRNTTIKEELSNNVIIIPNARLAGAIFTNYHLPAKEITLKMNVGVSYDSDLEQVEGVTVEVAKLVMQEVSPELIDTEPFIRFDSFEDFSINFTVFIRVNEFYDQRLAKHLFIKKLHKRYQQEGIKIPFPTRDIYLQENKSNEV